MKKAMLQLHTAIFLAGFTAILGKLISLTAIQLVWWRLVMTVLVLWIFVSVTRNNHKQPVYLVRRLLGVGALVGLHWVCFFGSVKFANVSIALVCFSASGFFSAIIQPFFNRRFSLFEMVLGLLSMAGIYIIFHFDSRYKTGIALGVAAAFLSALFSMFNKGLVGKIGSIPMTFYEMIGALCILSVLLPFYAVNGDVNFWPSPMDWVWLLILSLVCTVWAFVLQLKALQHISAFTLNISYNLEPVYGIVLAFIFFKENEHLHLSFYFGAFLILLAILVQMWMVKRKHAVG